MCKEKEGGIINMDDYRKIQEMQRINRIKENNDIRVEIILAKQDDELAKN